MSDIHRDLHNPDGSTLWWRTGSVQPNPLHDIKTPNIGTGKRWFNDPDVIADLHVFN